MTGLSVLELLRAIIIKTLTSGSLATCLQRLSASYLQKAVTI